MAAVQLYLWKAEFFDGLKCVFLTFICKNSDVHIYSIYTMVSLRNHTLEIVQPRNGLSFYQSFRTFLKKKKNTWIECETFMNFFKKTCVSRYITHHSKPIWLLINWIHEAFVVVVLFLTVWINVNTGILWLVITSMVGEILREMHIPPVHGYWLFVFNILFQILVSPFLGACVHSLSLQRHIPLIHDI